MRQLKFYGRTLDGTLYRVKRELGEDALIVQTRTIEPGSATERTHPGARFEVTAAVEAPVAATTAPAPESADEKGGIPLGPATPPIPAGGEDSKRSWLGQLRTLSGQKLNFGDWVKQNLGAKHSPVIATPVATAAPTPAPPRIRPSPTVLEDLALLKAQVRGLIEESGNCSADIRNHDDLADYRFLINQGIDPAILARSFRRWLDWRLSGKGAEVAFPPLFDPDKIMKGKGLREWLWNEWRHQLTFFAELKAQRETKSEGTQIVGIVGASGVGKSTTLAKLASKERLEERKRVAILSLDGERLGANEQWRRQAKLMDLAFMEAVTQEEIGKCVQLFERFDWVGIDTPGGMAGGSKAAGLYGSLLARSAQARTILVLDASSRDRVNREQTERMRIYHPDRLIFSKLDESPERGGMVNLTLEEPWVFEAASTGRRVPEDLEPVTPEALWRWVFEDADASVGAAS